LVTQVRKVQLAPRAPKASLVLKDLVAHKVHKEYKVFKVPRESKGRVVFKAHEVKLDQLVPLDSLVH
jgi:hypothetical protein